MPEFIKKQKPVEANRWDGTLESAKIVMEKQEGGWSINCGYDTNFEKGLTLTWETKDSMDSLWIAEPGDWVAYDPETKAMYPIRACDMASQYAPISAVE